MSVSAIESLNAFTTADLPEVVKRCNAKGLPTGQMFKKDKPREYAIICQMVKERIPVISIARIMGVSRQLAEAIRQTEMMTMPLADIKEAISHRWMNAFSVSMDIIEEIAEDPERRAAVSLKDAAVVAGIATEKHALMNGDVTARVEHVEAVSEHNDLGDFLATMKRANPVIDVTEPKKKLTSGKK
jgi:hypothetical protein